MFTNILMVPISLKQKNRNLIETKPRIEWVPKYLKYNLYTLKY